MSTPEKEKDTEIVNDGAKLAQAHQEISQRTRKETAEEFKEFTLNIASIERLSVLALQNQLWHAQPEEKRTISRNSPLQRLTDDTDKQTCSLLQRMPFLLYHALLKEEYLFDHPAGRAFWRILSHALDCIPIKYVLHRVAAPEQVESKAASLVQMPQNIIAFARTDEEANILRADVLDTDEWLAYLRAHPELQRREEPKKREQHWFPSMLEEVERDADGVITKNPEMQLPLPIPDFAQKKVKATNSFQEIMNLGGLVLSCDDDTSNMLSGLVSMFHMQDSWVEAVQNNMHVMFLVAAEDIIRMDIQAPGGPKHDVSKEITDHCRQHLYSRFFHERLEDKRLGAALQMQLPESITGGMTQISKSIHQLGQDIQEFMWKQSTARKNEPCAPFELSTSIRHHVQTMMKRPSVFMSQMITEFVNTLTLVLIAIQRARASKAFIKYLTTNCGLSPAEAASRRESLLIQALLYRQRIRNKEAEALAPLTAPGAEDGFIETTKEKRDQQEQADAQRAKARAKEKRKRKAKKTSPGKDEATCDEPQSPEMPPPPPPISRQVSSELSAGTAPASAPESTSPAKDAPDPRQGKALKQE